MRARFVLIVLLLVGIVTPGFAQLSPSAKWAAEFATQYTVNANLSYRTASNQQLKMDVYYRRNVSGPPVVPYPEAVRLHEALAKINSPNQLVTIPGGAHGNFSAEERVRIYVTIREF